MTKRWELEYHLLIQSLIRITRNLRIHECDHCSLLLTQVIKCMDKETPDIRRRSNDE